MGIASPSLNKKMQEKFKTGEPCLTTQAFGFAAAMGNKVLRQLPDYSLDLDVFLTLPGLFCQALGGDPQRAKPISEAWNLLYQSAYLLDQAADEDLDKHELGTKITLAALWIAKADLILDYMEQAGVAPETAGSIRYDFHTAFYNVSLGQLADLNVKLPSLEEAWQIAEAKTGKMFALASHCGARLATQNEQLVSMAASFGDHLGIMIQIADDAGGLLERANSSSDLRCGKWTLPVAYAMSVLENEERAILQKWISDAKNDPAFEQKARQMIIESGGLLYLATAAESRRQEACDLLESISPTEYASNQLLRILNGIHLHPET